MFPLLPTPEHPSSVEVLTSPGIWATRLRPGPERSPSAGRRGEVREMLWPKCQPRPKRPGRRPRWPAPRPPLRRQPALKRAQFIGRADEQRVHGADPAAISGGVESCRREPRIITLTMSAPQPRPTLPWRGQIRERRRPPRRAEGRHRDKSFCPVRRPRGKRAWPGTWWSAPTAGAARSMPGRAGGVQDFVRKNRHQRHSTAQQNHKTVQRKRASSRGESAHSPKAREITFSEAARFSILPSRTWRLRSAAKKKQTSVTRVKRRQSGALEARIAQPTHSGSVNSSPPRAGP